MCGIISQPNRLLLTGMDGLAFRNQGYAGITCEISTVNKMAARKLLLFFLPLPPSETGLLQKRIV